MSLWKEHIDAHKYFHSQFVSADFGVPYRVEIVDECVQIGVLDSGSGILEQFVGHLHDIVEHDVPAESIVIGIPFKNDCASAEHVTKSSQIKVLLLDCLLHALNANVRAPPIVKNEVVAHPRYILVVYVSVDYTLVVEEDDVAKEPAKFLNHNRIAGLC